MSDIIEGACGNDSFSSVPMSDFFANAQQSQPIKPLHQEDIANCIPWEPRPASSGRRQQLQPSEVAHAAMKNATCTAQEQAPPRFQGCRVVGPTIPYSSLVICGRDCFGMSIPIREKQYCASLSLNNFSPRRESTGA